MRDLVFFWELLNEDLSEVTGRKDYKFNPKAVMFDKKSANCCGIKEVFRLEFMASKVVSCQMYFKNDVNKPSSRLGAVSEKHSSKNMHCDVFHYNCS